MRKNLLLLLNLLWFCVLALAQSPAGTNGYILQSRTYKHYIDAFNQGDNELYKEYIPNSEAWNFLSNNIPLLDCPDKKIEQTYYFRWWTYRKHIKKTPAGFVIVEFMPAVDWAGKYNTINCAAALHIYEGRWLHDQQYLNDYANFWLRGGGNLRSYSFWIADAMYNQYLVTNQDSLIRVSLPALVANYAGWEKEKLDSSGLFWQVDDRDGMEMSICGSGYRATINAYMYADANALAKIAALDGKTDLVSLFTEKKGVIKNNIQQKLWDRKDEFFKVLPRNATELCTARELHGFTPWYFNIPDQQYSKAWKFLMDPAHFFAPYGPTTADQGHKKFEISYKGHECQWNGPSWPMATSITLTALANLLNNYKQSYISKNDYYTLLKIYTKSQQLIKDDGSIVSWVDENLNPFTGDWISRTRLSTWKNNTWAKDKGGVERGKDYNHSTYCDLIISGLIGVQPQPGNSVIISPLLPENTWDYFCLDNVLYHGKMLTVLFDKSGKHYNKGKGMHVFIDGRKLYSSAKLSRAVVKW